MTSVTTVLPVTAVPVVADAGYCSHEQVSRCAALGVEANVPNEQHRVAGTGAYPRESFRYSRAFGVKSVSGLYGSLVKSSGLYDIVE